MRRVIFQSLVGSHNYNLDDIDSDKDYKVFTMPSFDDLYNNKMKSNQTIGEFEDYDYHDIRKIVNLFYKSNLNFLEVLYSKEVRFGKDVTNTEKKMVNEIFDMKDEIVVMNLKYLFRACGGMHMQKMKSLTKGTEGTKHLVKMYGYDTKEALHAFRIIDLLYRFESLGFKNFDKAMRYNESERSFMLGIKNGFFELGQFVNFVNFYHDAKFKTLKEKFYSFEENLETKERLEEIVKNLVIEGIRKEMYSK